MMPKRDVITWVWTHRDPQTFSEWCSRWPQPWHASHPTSGRSWTATWRTSTAGGLHRETRVFFLYSKNIKAFCWRRIRLVWDQKPTIRNQRCWWFHNSPAGLLEHVNLRWRDKEQRWTCVVYEVKVHKRAAERTVIKDKRTLLSGSTWLHGRSGFDSTSPGPIMLNVASMCMGFGSLKEIMWTL